MRSLVRSLIAPVRLGAVEAGGGGGQVEIRREVEFAVHGGQSLKGHLYMPSAPGKYPAVVCVHGGGWQMGVREVYQFWGPWLAARGYVVFAMTYRLAKVGQKTFPEAVQDVRAAVQFMKGKAAEFKVDPDRVAIMGDSAGAHLSMMVALAGEHENFKGGNAGDAFGNLSSKVKVAVGVYGVYDLYRQFCSDLSARPRDSITEKFVGASAIDDKRPYFEASPLSYVSAKDNTTAVLLSWGTDDDVVNYREHSEVMLQAMKHAGFFVRTVAVPGAPHFWMADPIEEASSFSGFLAPRLLRFLQTRL